MSMTINADAGLILIILVALLFLHYFIRNSAYEKGFNEGLKLGKKIGKSDAMMEVEDDNT